MPYFIGFLQFRVSSWLGIEKNCVTTSKAGSRRSLAEYSYIIMKYFSRCLKNFLVRQALFNGPTQVRSNATSHMREKSILNRELSGWLKINIGLTWTSLFGPNLIIIFNNDLHENLAHVIFHLVLPMIPNYELRSNVNRNCEFKSVNLVQWNSNQKQLLKRQRNNKGVHWSPTAASCKETMEHIKMIFFDNCLLKQKALFAFLKLNRHIFQKVRRNQS